MKNGIKYIFRLPVYIFQKTVYRFVQAYNIFIFLDVVLRLIIILILIFTHPEINIIIHNEI